MKYFGVLLVLLSLSCCLGCTSRHSEGLGKNVTILELYPGGQYRLWNTGIIRTYDEKGRWWPIEGEVSVLVPDDASLYERFVNTTESGLFDDLAIYDSLREALANEHLPEPTRRTLTPFDDSASLP